MVGFWVVLGLLIVAVTVAFCFYMYLCYENDRDPFNDKGLGTRLRDVEQQCKKAALIIETLILAMPEEQRAKLKPEILQMADVRENNTDLFHSYINK